MNIFIAKLSASTTSEDLQELFSEYGEVSSAKVIFDRETGNSKRFGFVEMDDDEQANNAIRELNDCEYDNSKIVVKEARPREEMGGNRRGGQGGGGYRQRREGGGGYGGGREGGGYKKRY